MKKYYYTAHRMTAGLGRYGEHVLAAKTKESDLPDEKSNGKIAKKRNRFA